MAKATSRKHATHHRKARSHHAAKTHVRRSSVSSGSSAASVMNPEAVNRDAEIIDDESTVRPDPRAADMDTEEEISIYGANQGESAGESDEATS
jgi:hypothetical protein